MPILLLRRFLLLWLLCAPAALLLGSCSAARVHQQNILFRADGDGRLDTAKLRDVVNRAERNYIIQPNDQLEVRVYTNEGERILDPNGELQFGIQGGATGGVEVFSAAVNVLPAFKMHALGVLALEHIIVEFIVAAFGAKALQMRFAFGVKVGFIRVNATVWAVQS